MARYLTTRVVYGFITVVIVVLLTFVVQFMLPGDPARVIAGPRASAAVLANVRENLHLNDSLLSQLWQYVSAVARGDLGVSYSRKQPVSELIGQRLPATAALGASGLAIGVVLGTVLGVWESLRERRSWLLASINVGLLSIPTFALAFLLLLLFGYVFPIFPVDGGTGWSRLVLPALTLGVLSAPYYANVTRDGMKEALASSYTRTAVAKGLPRRFVIARHVFRNAMPPTITMVGMDIAVMFSGVVFVETIFGWPGIGELQTQAFADVDRPLLTGTVIVASVLVVVGNLIADVIRALVDPRVKVDEL